MDINKFFHLNLKNQCTEVHISEGRKKSLYIILANLSQTFADIPSHSQLHANFIPQLDGMDFSDLWPNKILGHK